jgi:hypothetical protein
MPRYKILVMSNATEGREDEFNEWYTREHLPDVLRVPGIVAAQRLRRTDTQPNAGPFPWKYMALYECETDDVQQLIDSLKARAGTPEMPISGAFADSPYVCYFEPIAELRTGTIP